LVSAGCAVLAALAWAGDKRGNDLTCLLGMVSLFLGDGCSGSGSTASSTVQSWGVLMLNYIVGMDIFGNEVYWSARFKRLTALINRACFYDKRGTAKRRMEWLNAVHPSYEFSIKEMNV
jgi:hypothetical protein